MLCFPACPVTSFNTVYPSVSMGEYSHRYSAICSPAYFTVLEHHFWTLALIY